MTAARLEGRAAGPSDADLDVVTAIAEREPPWAEAVTIDTSGPLEAAVSQALATVRPHDTGPLVFRHPYMERVPSSL